MTHRVAASELPGWDVAHTHPATQRAHPDICVVQVRGRDAVSVRGMPLCMGRAVADAGHRAGAMLMAVTRDPVSCAEVEVCDTAFSLAGAGGRRELVDALRAASASVERTAGTLLDALYAHAEPPQVAIMPADGVASRTALNVTSSYGPPPATTSHATPGTGGGAASGGMARYTGALGEQ
jgi:hypothetical protein